MMKQQKTKCQDVTIKDTYDLPGMATVEIRVSADVTKYQAAKALMVWLIKYMESSAGKRAWRRDANGGAEGMLAAYDLPEIDLDLELPDIDLELPEIDLELPEIDL